MKKIVTRTLVSCAALAVMGGALIAPSLAAERQDGTRETAGQSTVSTLSAVSTSSAAAGQTADIGETEAKEIALEQAGLTAEEATWLFTKRDYEDGRLEYEVKFLSGSWKYEVDVDAATGAVTSGLFMSQRSTIIIFTKLAAARHVPQQRDTRNSFHSTRSRSEKRTSPRDKARMTAVEACVPLLPPVPESMGMKAVRMAQAEREDSKWVRMIPVKVAESIRISSQGVRALKVSMVPVLR